MSPPRPKFGCFALFVLLACGLGAQLLVGCGGEVEPAQTNAPDEAGRTSGLGQAMTGAESFATDHNISQINQVLGAIKMDGPPPATLEEAKRAVKVPDENWIDKATGKPLVYNPTTGTVSR